MITKSQARFSGNSNRVAFFHIVSNLHVCPVEVPIKRVDAITMVPETESEE